MPSRHPDNEPFKNHHPMKVDSFSTNGNGEAFRAAHELHGDESHQPEATSLCELLDQLEEQLNRLERRREDEETGCEVCLASRSAYSDYHTQSVIFGVLERDVTDRLESLLARAVNLLPAGKYRDSVSQRQQEFVQFVGNFLQTDPLDSFIPGE